MYLSALTFFYFLSFKSVYARARARVCVYVVKYPKFNTRKEGPFQTLNKITCNSIRNKKMLKM